MKFSLWTPHTSHKRWHRVMKMPSSRMAKWFRGRQRARAQAIYLKRGIF